MIRWIYSISSEEETATLALRVVAWTVSEQARAERLLAITGIDPGTLRARLGEPALLGALIDFLLDHEPDLYACAEALDVTPAAIAAARERLNR